MKTIFAVVRTGNRYLPEDVNRTLKAMATHVRGPAEFVCVTDAIDPAIEAAQAAVVSPLLPGWFGKLKLFDPSWRDHYGGGPVIYSDLDNLICGSLAPLEAFDLGFGICRNFTRAGGNLSWPCAYGSCVMAIPAGFGEAIWREVERAGADLIEQAGRFGDQWIIERLYPDAYLLQEHMPAGFLVGYRDLARWQHRRPPGVAVVAYAGGRSPATMGPPWALAEWRRQTGGE